MKGLWKAIPFQYPFCQIKGAFGRSSPAKGDPAKGGKRIGYSANPETVKLITMGVLGPMGMV